MRRIAAQPRRCVDRSRVAQVDLQLALALLLDLDEVLIAERDELVAIFDEHVEIGVGDRRLIFARCLEGHRLNGVIAVRLGFEYAWFEQTYGDDVKAHNSRFDVSGFYLF